MITMTDDADPPVDTSRVWTDEFEALYRERHGPMVRLAALICGDAGAAEEIVQDAFVAVHGALAARPDGIDNPPAYLRRSVVNGCHSWGRRQTMRADRERRIRPEPVPGADATFDHLWDSLQSLPHRQRAAVVMRFYDDLSDREIAAALDCREATVRTTIHRALRALRREIER